MFLWRQRTTSSRGRRALSVCAASAIVLLGLWVVAAPTKPPSGQAQSRPGLLTSKEEHARAAKVVGPENTAHNCAACHMFEDHAWQHTHHFTGFTRRHRTQTAHEILQNMEQLSMKRQGTCRQCHYTSTLQDDKLMPQWGVSCESCHGPAKDWVNIHDRIGGDPKGAMLKWGQGKTETSAERDARLSAAEARGMISSRMIYDLASRCIQCHIVSDEQVVNQGKHPADSDFDLVGWSQGEMRHNFVDSPGAPDHPTNRQLKPNERRRMYVVGVAADLEYSLRNVLAARESDGAFEQVMIERANDAHDEFATILKLVQIPELQSALAQLPPHITTPADVAANLPARIGRAARLFTAYYDGSTLEALDAHISTDVVGAPYRR